MDEEPGRQSVRDKELPLDVRGIDLSLTRDEIVETVREVRFR